MTTAELAPARLVHEAFVYGDDATYVSTLVPELQRAVARGWAVVAVVPRHNAALLRRSLGTASHDVRFVAAETWYRTPGVTTAAYDRILRELGETPSVVIGEVQFGTTEDDWRAWTRYESALNRALEHHGSRVICPYDARVLAPTVIADALRTHPVLLAPDGRRRSDAYVDPEHLLAELPPEVGVPDGAPDISITVGDLRAARRAFAATAAAAGVAPARVDDLTFAVNEVVTNALLHGEGTVTLRVWSGGDGSLVCVVDDAGAGSDDPLLGHRPPAVGAEGGYGLWVARQLFDRSHVGTAATGGLQVVLAVG